MYSVKSLAKATEKHILDQKRGYRKDVISDIADSTSKNYNEEEYVLTPCRFAPSGWKYVRKTV